jgi:hypothetical protein
MYETDMYILHTHKYAQVWTLSKHISMHKNESKYVQIFYIQWKYTNIFFEVSNHENH